MSKYVRETKDEYQIHGNYGLGFEKVWVEDGYKEAKIQLKCYRENERGITFKIVKKRIKL